MTDGNDHELFRGFIGKVRRLTADKVHLQKNKKPLPVPSKRSIECDPSGTDTGLPVLAELSVADTLDFMEPGVQKNVFRKLKRGFFGIDAELDLHGLTARQAKCLLNGFLQRCAGSQFRCIHIIHGKGYRSAGQKPVLKNKLNVWLRQHPDVLAFCSASPANGGTGAVYVLLKLHR